MNFARTAVLAILCAVCRGQAAAEQATASAAAQPGKTAVDIATVEEDGMGKMIKGDTAGALAGFDAAIAESHSSEAYAARGRMHMRLRRFREAASDFAAASAKDPANPDLIYVRAMAEVKAGQPQKSVDLITKLLKTSPKFPDARLIRAEAWRALGKYKKAAADFDDEITIFSDRPLARLSRGYFHLSRGNGAEAFEDFSGTEKLSPSPEARLAKIMALIEMEKCDAAKEQLGLLLAPDRTGFSQQEATATAAYLLNCRQNPSGAVELLGKTCLKISLPLDEMKSGGLLAPLFKGLDHSALSDLDKACPTDTRLQ